MNIPGKYKIQRLVNYLNKRGIVLMYHRVVDLNFDSLQLSVSNVNFEEHISIIKKYGRPVQLKEMGINLRYFSLGQKDIVITFDDGYADNFHNAKPILERHEMPATFFIATGAVNNNEEYYWHSLERCLLEPEILPEKLEITISAKNYHWRIRPEGICKSIDYSHARMKIPPNNQLLSRSQLYFVLNKIVNCESTDIKKTILQKLATWAGQSLKSRVDYLPMTSDELRSMARSGLFEIGAHTINHPMLSRLTIADQEKEISASKQFLEELLGKSVNSFSYPYGDYSNETLKIVKRLKFNNACTVVHHPVFRNENPYLLPRFSVLNWNGEQFEEKLRHWLYKY